MHIKATEPRRGQHRPGQYQAVGSNHRYIGAERGEPRPFLLRPQADRSADGEPILRSQQLHRRGLRAVTTAGRARRLAIDGKDMVPGSNQRIKDGRGETGRAHKNEVEHLLVAGARRGRVLGCVSLW